MDEIYENDKKAYIDIQDNSVYQTLKLQIEALEKRIEALEKNQNRYQ